jgi:hypothetical protein
LWLLLRTTLNGKCWAHHRFSRFNRSAGDIVLYALTAA